jgi:RHS repeat-associated protein
MKAIEKQKTNCASMPKRRCSTALPFSISNFQFSTFPLTITVNQTIISKTQSSPPPYVLPFSIFNFQFSTPSTPYKFSAKEKDEETGYSYFGARYYWPEVSVWLSVDPPSDKYPSMSAYMYCAGNPVVLVDPDGRNIDEFGVKITGEIVFIRSKPGPHELYKVDGNGRKVDVNGDGKMTENTDYVTFGRNDITSLSKFTIIEKDAGDYEIGRSWGINAKFSNSESAEKIFNFITSQKDNDKWKTSVEWGLADFANASGDKQSTLMTSRSKNVIGAYEDIDKMFRSGYHLLRHIHNHPSNNPKPSTGYQRGDLDFKDLVQRNFKCYDATFQIKTKYGLKDY